LAKEKLGLKIGNVSPVNAWERGEEKKEADVYFLACMVGRERIVGHNV